MCSVSMLVPVKARHIRNTCTIIIIESSRLQSRDIYTLHNTASVTLLPPQSSNRPRFDPTLCNYCLSNHVSRHNWHDHSGVSTILS